MRDVRVPFKCDVTWELKGQSLSGKAELRDVSLRGASLCVDRSLDVKGTLVFSFACEALPSFPITGRLRWFRAAPRPATGLYIGVVFVQEDPAKRAAWETWVHEQLSQLPSAQRKHTLADVVVDPRARMLARQL
ncbi:MAG: PilZ domain-containing protein [Acidobacteriota bacterium]